MQTLSALIALVAPCSIAVGLPADERHLADVVFLLESFEKEAGELLRVKGVDWAAVRKEFTAAAAAVKSDQDHVELCARLIARLQDGHAGFTRVDVDMSGRGPGPTFGCGLELVEVGKKVHVKRAFGSAASGGIEAGSEVVKIDGLAAGAREHSVRGKAVIGTMQNVMGIAGRLEAVVAGSSLRSFVELAKLDHLVFKFRVYRALLGQLELAPSGLASHQACRLGKWYYEGEGQRRFSHLHGYRGLERPHRLVHESAAQAVALSGQGGDADAILECVETMEHASLEVLGTLEKMAVSGVSEPGDGHAGHRPAQRPGAGQATIALTRSRPAFLAV